MMPRTLTGSREGGIDLSDEYHTDYLMILRRSIHCFPWGDFSYSGLAFQSSARQGCRFFEKMFSHIYNAVEQSAHHSPKSGLSRDQTCRISPHWESQR